MIDSKKGMAIPLLGGLVGLAGLLGLVGVATIFFGITIGEVSSLIVKNKNT